MKLTLNQISISPNLTVDDFKPGDIVSYVPNHLVEDYQSTKDKNLSETGIVSSVNDKYVFVKYVKNDVLSNAQATPPNKLINHGR